MQADAAKNENVPGVASSARASSELTPATLHEISSSAQHDNTYMSTKKKTRLCVAIKRAPRIGIVRPGASRPSHPGETNCSELREQEQEQKRLATGACSNDDDMPTSGAAMAALDRVHASALRLRSNRRRRAASSAESQLHGGGGGDAAGDQERHVRHLLPGTAHLLQVPGDLLPVGMAGRPAARRSGGGARRLFYLSIP